jgi:PAS domain S-box-containing protein
MQTLRTARVQKPGTNQTKVAVSDHLHHLAFDNSLQANIISRVSDGKIIDANIAACKLLEYSKKDLLAKSRKDIFNISERSYINMLKKRTAEGYVKANIAVIKKNGKQLHGEITSVIFVDRGIENSITTIVDMSEILLKQKNIDTRKLDKQTKLKTSQIAYAVTKAHEQERSDIGKELHDNVNQLLAVSRLYIDMASKNDANKEMYLRRSSEYSLNAIEEIRKLTRGMITDVIKDIGLCEAIDKTIKDAMEIHPIKIICTQDNLIEKRLNDKFKMNIFRIVQEQLNNILKHAKASMANISLSQNKNTILLSITDNGVGFNITKRMKGIGMKNIKSRAKFFGGNANFVSQPGKGCTLTITFPVRGILLNQS